MRTAFGPRRWKSGRLVTCPKESLAGEEGFEPSNAGIKIRCLDQLGDSPAGCSNGFASKRGANNTGADPGNPALLANFCEWVPGQAFGYPALHAGGKSGEQGFGLLALREAGEDAGPGAGHHRLWRMLLQPGEMFGDGRELGAGNDLKIVVALSGAPPGRGHRRRVALQFRGAENGRRGHVDRGV